MIFGLTEQQFKKIVGPVILALTSFLVIYEMIQITDDTIFKAGLLIAAVTVEMVIQYDLALAIAHWRVKGFKPKFKSVVLYFFWVIYVIVFALLAGIGFFKAELDGRGQPYQTVKAVQDSKINRLTALSGLIETANLLIIAESKTGNGPRAQMAMGDLKRFSAEQIKLQAELAGAAQSSDKVPKNLFRSLEEVFGQSEDFFKVLIFGTLILMLYLGQILTAWHVEIDVGPKSKTNSDLPSNNKPIVTIPDFILPVESAPCTEPELDDERAEMIKFVNALYKPNGGNALYGDSMVSMKTDIPVRRCADYKDRLSRVKVDGEPLIHRRQGGSETKFPREVLIKKIIDGSVL